MTYRRTIAAATLAALLSAPGPAPAQELPEVRAAVLAGGTVNWELDTIVRNGLDEKHGFRLTMQPFADNGATRVAMAGGEADMFVADWIWVARQDAEGKDYVVIPYSTAVGSILVKADSPAETLPDLEGKKIGIAGGPLDKSWLILRAYATQEYGLDLAAETEQVYAAPPLVMKAAESGEVDAAINFWHFLAKMKAGGMRELVSVEAAATALGLDPDLPLLGYVFQRGYLDANPDLAANFYAASREAKAMLATDAAAWEALRPQMNAADDAEFEALKRDWIAGIPEDARVDPKAAAKLLRVMADLGGEELVGKAETLPEGMFADVP